MKKNHENKFEVPPNYFDDFNAKLLAKIKTQKPEPDTSFLPKTAGFKVPNNYLANFKIDPQPNKVKVVNLAKWRTWSIGLAAAAAVVFFIAIVSSKNKTQPSFNNLASADVEAYLLENTNYYQLEEITQILVLDTANMALEDFENSDISQEVLLEYLEDNVNNLPDLNYQTNDKIY